MFRTVCWLVRATFDSNKSCTFVRVIRVELIPRIRTRVIIVDDEIDVLIDI